MVIGASPLGPMRPMDPLCQWAHSSYGPIAQVGFAHCCMGPYLSLAAAYWAHPAQRKHDGASPLCFAGWAQYARWLWQTAHTGPICYADFVCFANGPYCAVLPQLGPLCGSWRYFLAQRTAGYGQQVALRQLCQMGPKVSPAAAKRLGEVKRGGVSPSKLRVALKMKRRNAKIIVQSPACCGKLPPAVQNGPSKRS